MANGVTGDVFCALVGAKMASSFTNDKDELGLVIDLLTDRGQYDGIFVADERGGVFAEEDRVLGDGDAAFLGVVGIVEAEADDLARIGNGWEQLDLPGGVSSSLVAP